MEYSKLIKAERERQGMSRKELAEKAGVTDRAVSYWESGKRHMNLESAGRVFRALNIIVNNWCTGGPRVERLTDGIYTFKGKTEDVENNYILAVQRKLKEYEDLEEQGKLVKLPFAVGDAAYYITDGAIEPCTVQRIILFNDKGGNGSRAILMEIHFNRKDCLWVSTEVWCAEIGRTVFLTREEAEAELQGMEEPHEEEKEQPE